MRTVRYQFDGGGSHNGSPAGWGWAAFVDGVEVACGRGALAPGTSNNVAEYTGLIRAMEYAVIHDWGDEEFLHHFYGDSRLVVEQCHGRYQVKAAHLAPLQAAVRVLMGTLECELTWHPRSENARADELATEGRHTWTGKSSKTWRR